MDPAYVDHLTKNPQAGQARPRATRQAQAPLSAEESKSRTVKKQERYLRLAERQVYEEQTKALRSEGKPVPRFVCSLDEDKTPPAELPAELPSELPSESKPKGKAAKKDVAKDADKKDSQGANDAAAEAFKKLEKAQEGK